MEITIAKYAGMCGGVKSTIIKTNKILDNNKDKKVYALGELVHNKVVVRKLEAKGMTTVEDIEEIPDNSIVIFRAHGVTKDTYKRAEEKHLEINDLTCKNVLSIHEKIKEKKDSLIILLGKKDHAEVVASISFANDDAIIIENHDDLIKAIEKANSSSKDKIYVVGHTTYSSKLFDEYSEELVKGITNKEVIVEKTICMATEIRQDEANNLSKNADTCIVIGGKNSSNTMKLFNIAKENCSNVIFIEDENELDMSMIKGDKVLILAGASTPEESIEKTKNKIEK